MQVWDRFDTGRADGWTACYLDGRLVGEVRDRDATMGWDAGQVRFHLGSGLVGWIDEAALFGRPLTAPEIQRLFTAPGVLEPLKRRP